MTKTSYIDLVGKTIVLLEMLRDSPRGLSLQELTLRTGYVKSSIHRILQSLRHYGYVEQEEAGRIYRLGLEVMILGRSVQLGSNLLQLGHRHLVELSRTFDESAFLAVLQRGDAFFVDVQETTRDLRLVSPLGVKIHFHATAAGKAIAAHLPPERQDEMLSSLDLIRLTDRTITNRFLLEAEWREARRRGYATNNEETHLGAYFIAAPVFDVQQTVCGSISIGVPLPRYSIQQEEKISEELMASCQRLSAALEAVGFVNWQGIDAAA